MYSENSPSPDCQRISDLIDTKKELLTRISDEIWGYAELKFEEYRSAALLCKVLREEGFEVERNVAGMATAFLGRFGSGKPVIGILGEFDALFGMSQAGGTTHKQPVIQGAPGHGCGHHLLGTGSLAAAIALRYLMAESDLKGTILYFGCPGEEGGFGKTYMVREGVFDGVDCALTWHPAAFNNISYASTLANINVYYRFTGKSSHAAMAPHLGRSALDSLELMNVGVNYLREHIPSDARMHYAVTNTGGKTPNVVQAEGEEYFCMRSPNSSQLREIFERVCDVARGAALMAGTSMTYEIDSAVSEAIPNRTLARLMHQKFAQLGVVDYNREDRLAAEKYYGILSDEVKRSIPKEMAGTALAEFLEPICEVEGLTMGSTDVADVSWITPTAECWVACAASGTPLHSWEMVAQGTTSLAHKGMLHAGKVIACTAAELLRQPDIIAEAKNELKERLGGQVYTCPIPTHVKPSKTGKH